MTEARLIDSLYGIVKANAMHSVNLNNAHCIPPYSAQHNVNRHIYMYGHYRTALNKLQNVPDVIKVAGMDMRTSTVLPHERTVEVAIRYS